MNDSKIITYTRDAMAGEFQIEVVSGRDDSVAIAAVAALDEVTRLESILSVFRSDSVVARLNASAAYVAVTVSDEVMQLILTAKEMTVATDGAFDITSYPLTQLWGSAKRERRIPTDAEIAATRRLVGWENIVIDVANRTVRFTEPGVGISFGAIGKGMAVDAAAVVMRRYGACDFLIHGGMSSVIAHGNDGASDGWTIGIAHPVVPTKRHGHCVVRDRALATSGTQKQFFRYAGKRFGHIIDPQTGVPADAGVLGVTVFAPTAAEADALSTAMFTMGRKRIETFIAERCYDLCLATVADNAIGYEITTTFAVSP
ncbi:MAG: FAD:protein FMN transferase [Thermoguttaceae bacterium]